MGASGGANMTDEERKQAAQLIWNQEKGLAATFLIIGWLFKVRIPLVCFEMPQSNLVFTTG